MATPGAVTAAFRQLAGHDPYWPLATLGEGHIAYVKQIRSEDVPGLFPQAPKIAPGLKLFALHAADGTPIMLTDSREAAVANAWSNELQAVSVH